MSPNLWLVNRPIHIGQHRGLLGQFVIWAILMFLWSDSHYRVLLALIFHSHRMACWCWCSVKFSTTNHCGAVSGQLLATPGPGWQFRLVLSCYGLLSPSSLAGDKMCYWEEGLWSSGSTQASEQMLQGLSTVRGRATVCGCSSPTFMHFIQIL